MKLIRSFKLFSILMLLWGCSLVASAEIAREIMDNAKLLEGIKGGLSPKVIMTTIKDGAKDCHFTSTMKDKIALQAACKAASPAWSETDIDALQMRVNELAQKSVTEMRNLVNLFLTAAENYANDGDQQYDELKHKLMAAGGPVVQPLLDNLNQESERKRRGILDALVDIGDKGDIVVQACRMKLDDPSAPVRAQAAKAVAALAGPTTGDQLVQMLNRRDAKNDAVALALGYMRSQKAVDPLVDMLENSRDTDERVCAAFALGYLRAKSQAARDALLKAILDDKDEKLRRTAAKSAALIGDRRTPEYVMKAFNRFRPGRAEILDVLVYFKSIPAAKFLAGLLDTNESDDVRKAAMKTLELMTNEKYDSAEDWMGFITRALENVRPEWQEPKDPNKLPEPNDPK